MADTTRRLSGYPTWPEYHDKNALKRDVLTVHFFSGFDRVSHGSKVS